MNSPPFPFFLFSPSLTFWVFCLSLASFTFYNLDHQQKFCLLLHPFLEFLYQIWALTLTSNVYVYAFFDQSLLGREIRCLSRPSFPFSLFSPFSLFLASFWLVSNVNFVWTRNDEWFNCWIGRKLKVGDDQIRSFEGAGRLKRSYIHGDPFLNAIYVTYT